VSEPKTQTSLVVKANWFCWRYFRLARERSHVLRGNTW